MRPTTNIMLQQNNNNNYPCLNVSGEMLQKPFPSRLELGLGDLPLIRGLRAWALFSKNRCKTGGLLGAPAAPPAGHGSSTPCPRPADVYLGYGIPLGLDARQAGIGALVTVATLKTSEGSGKTQTQCLFLRTEKGSCLYSTAKPNSGATASVTSRGVGGWLRGKTGDRGRDTPAGKRDAITAHSAANRARVRSGRRWRKSGNAAGREKVSASKERAQKSREAPTGERQEDQDKRGPDSLHQESRRGGQEKEEACSCCHGVSPQICRQCGGKAQSGEDEEEGGGNPSEGIPNRHNGDVRGISRKNGGEEEEEESELESRNAVLTESKPDLESKNCPHSQSLSEEIRDNDNNNEELETQNPRGMAEDPNSDNDFIHVHPELSTERESDDGEETEHSSEVLSANRGGLSDGDPLEEMERAEGEEEGAEERSVNKTPPRPLSFSAHPTSSTIKYSTPAEGSALPADRDACGVRTEQENGPEEVDPGVKGVVENGIVEPPLLSGNEDNEEESETSPSLCTQIESVTTKNGCRTIESWWRDEDETKDETLNPQARVDAVEIWSSDTTCSELDSGTGDGLDGNQTEVRVRVPPEDSVRLDHSSEEDAGDSNVEINANASDVTCVGPSINNPDPSLPSLGSMATGLPFLEEEEEGVGISATAEDGGQERERRCEGEPEVQGTEERRNTVDATDSREEEEEEEEEEEDEFGVFMQADGESAWSDGVSVPRGSRESVGPGNQAVTAESTHWTPGWTDSQSDDAWAAFPRGSPDGGGDAAGQWWPTSAVEDRREGPSANQNPASVFAAAFSLLPDPCDLHTVPTLTQVLRGGAGQDKRLLDSFHDLNKMIDQRYKRADGVSRDLLLTTLHLERPHTEPSPAPSAANRRLSPGLPSANRHAQNTAAKRRLSYDYHRNAAE